jgi:protein required for attachment to host cells
MRTTWIVAANGGRARIFVQGNPAQAPQEIKDMVNTAQRMRVSETEPDSIGPTAATNSAHNIGGTQGVGLAHNAKAGAPNKAYQPAHTPDQIEAERFARDIAAYLLQAQRQDQFNSLVITAAPQFLGTLRAHLDPHLRPLVRLEVAKDYTQDSAQQLGTHLQALQANQQ